MAHLSKFSGKASRRSERSKMTTPPMQTADAELHASQAFDQALAWYSPIAARRWVVRSALALLISFGGPTGTALLFRQTLLLREQNQKLQEQIVLLRDQNQKLDLQTVTAEAQRRTGLTTELFSILQQTMSLSEAPSRTGPLVLPRGLTARIIAFSRAAAPYWTAEIPEISGDDGKFIPILARRPRSPERGQLFVGLVSAGVLRRH
jgi:hypothetical protein